MNAINRLVKSDFRLSVFSMPTSFDCDYDRMVIQRTPVDCWCANHPSKWPVWVGGQYDFLDQGQPFDKFEELRQATMKEL